MSRGVSIDKRKNHRSVFRETNGSPRDSIAQLSQGRKNCCISREGIPVDDSYGEKCEPVIVFECL